jgi:FKBP-type peptidyl-prolyl cis-trans isomerase
MKNILQLLSILLVFAACSPKTTPVAQAVPTPTPDPEPVKPMLKTFADTVSYVQGAYIANQIKNAEVSESFKLSIEKIQLGMSELDAGEVRFDEAQQQKILAKYQNELEEAFKKQNEAKQAANRKAGEDFLKANSTKEGVMTTASGLQYKVLEAGTGATPLASDRVEVHYEGRLIDGTVFDSSYKRGEPATFGVGQVISGWTEGLQLMKEGAKYQFFIPAKLAYGDRGAGAKIAPGATLIFDVELLKVIK